MQQTKQNENHTQQYPVCFATNNTAQYFSMDKPLIKKKTPLYCKFNFSITVHSFDTFDPDSQKSLTQAQIYLHNIKLPG